jgi:hypothetical protein
MSHYHVRLIELDWTPCIAFAVVRMREASIGDGRTA